MSANSKLVWELLQQTRYEKAQALIEANPKEDLVNAPDPKGYSILSIALISKSLPMGFLTFLAADRRLNLGYYNPSNKSKETNIQAIINTHDAGVFDVFSSRKDIVFNGESPSYIFVIACLKKATGLYDTAVQKRKANVDMYERRLTALQHMAKQLFALTLNCIQKDPSSLIAEGMLRHAISSDDSDLLQKLVDAGMDVSKPLSDGMMPILLVEKKHVNVCRWFDKRADCLSSQLLKGRVSDSPDLFELFRQEKTHREFQVEHHKAQSALTAEAAQESSEDLQHVISQLRI